MQYRGNPKLATALQSRIASAFEQALNHANLGKIQEAELGCEFILNMDPRFEPARILAQRLRNDQRPIHTADLKSEPIVGGATRTMEGLVDLTITDSDLDELEALEGLDDFGDLTLEELEAQPSTEAEPASTSSGLGTVLQDLLARRNFQQILQIAESQEKTIATSPELKAMVDQARQYQESDAFITSFLNSARAAQEAGNRPEARKQLDKAKVLDPVHPEVLKLASALAAAAGSMPPQQVEPEEPLGSAEPDGFGDLGNLSSSRLSFDEDDLATSLPPLDSDFLDDDDDADPLGTLAMNAIPGDALPDITPEIEAPAAGALDAGATIEAPPMVRGPAPAIQASANDQEDKGPIDKLLQQGKDAFEQGQFQTAIDTWSRIFLMDLDNQEAQDRIDEARTKKAEQERNAEEVFHEGVAHLDNGSPEDASASFRRTLALNPGHQKAKEFLDQLAAGEVPSYRNLLATDEALPSLAGSLSAEPAAASPSMDAAVERYRVAAAKKTDWRLVGIGAALLLAIVLVGGFVWTKKDDFFPNSKPAKASSGPRRPDPLARATAMHEGGNTENAINLLRRIRSEDPKHEEAQMLIEDWTKQLNKPAEPEAPSGPSEEAQTNYQLALDAARDAHQQQQYIRAQRYFDRAAKILPLQEADLLLKRECGERLLPLDAALSGFEQGEYALILPDLWRKYDKNPTDPNLRLLIVDSYYNLALRDLQRGSAKLAAEKLAEAITAEPDNEELARLILFAEAYSDTDQDLLYRIFVKYLPSR